MSGAGREIRRADAGADLGTITALARIIWTDHYTPIIGADQVAYMLRTVHSRERIRSEIESGSVEYYLIAAGGAEIGYFACKPEPESLFLSKLYILASARGKGAGAAALGFLRARAAALGLGTIRLTVNRHNTGSIAAYERIGFRKTGDVTADIGNGYVMDDHAMELAL